MNNTGYKHTAGNYEVIKLMEWDFSVEVPF